MPGVSRARPLPNSCFMYRSRDGGIAEAGHSRIFSIFCFACSAHNGLCLLPQGFQESLCVSCLGSCLSWCLSCWKNQATARAKIRSTKKWSNSLFSPFFTRNFSIFVQVVEPLSCVNWLGTQGTLTRNVYNVACSAPKCDHCLEKAPKS